MLIAEGDLRGAIADYDRALELADGLTLSDKWIIYLNRQGGLLKRELCACTRTSL